MKKRRKKKTCGKIAGGCLSAVLLFFLMTISVIAADAKVASVITGEDAVYFYIQGVSDVQSGSSVQIGNVVCENGNTSVTKLSEMSLPMRTIILLDNSKSIPMAEHEKIEEILLGVIEGTLEEEEVRIGVISDQINYLCDYTSDKEMLKQLISDVEYNDQDTYLSDVLYEQILSLNQEKSGIFTRIIIVADGADDKTIGYTNEEVRQLINQSPYPIYTIGILKKNNEAQLENLFSFSRAAGMESFLLDENTENTEVISALMKDQNNICIRVLPDVSLLDGSQKSVLLELQTAEGEVTLTTTAGMPFGKQNVEQPEVKSEEEPIVEDEVPAVTQEPDLPVIGQSAQEEEESKTPYVLILGIIVGVVALAILTGILIMKKKKKNPQIILSEMSEQEDENETEYLEDSDMTEMLGGFESYDNAVGLWRKKYICIKCMENEEIVFKIPAKDTISVGRRTRGHECDVNLEDAKVSKNHCVIILRGDMLYIKDLDSSNGTIYQEVHIKAGEEIPVVSGGVVRIGLYHYSIELIEE